MDVIRALWNVVTTWPIPVAGSAIAGVVIITSADAARLLLPETIAVTGLVAGAASGITGISVFARKLDKLLERQGEQATRLTDIGLLAAAKADKCLEIGDIDGEREWLEIVALAKHRRSDEPPD